jgi:hypothetical protein
MKKASAPIILGALFLPISLVSAPIIILQLGRYSDSWSFRVVPMQSGAPLFKHTTWYGCPPAKGFPSIKEDHYRLLYFALSKVDKQTGRESDNTILNNSSSVAGKR